MFGSVNNKLNTYESQHTYMLLVLLKIAYDEGLYEVITHEYLSDEQDPEDFYYDMEGMAIEILDNLYTIELLYKADEEEYTINIIDPSIENYHKICKKYAAKYEKERGSEIEEISKHNKDVLNQIYYINSYCYTVDIIEKDGIMIGIKFIHSPEFDLWFELVLAVYNIMNFYEKTAKLLDSKMKNETSIAA